MHDCKAYDAEPTAAHNRVGERRLGSVNYPAAHGRAQRAGWQGCHQVTGEDKDHG